MSRPLKLGALPLTTAYATAHPDEARDTAAKFLKLPSDAAAATPIPKWSLRLTAENLAPWVRIMKAQRMIHSDISLDKVIFP
jgi:ABC-type nitrate/sulfonate/bicarbonate transport system substrate-binding protein